MKVNYHEAITPLNVYHLYNRSGDFRNLFYGDNDYNRFLSNYHKLFAPYVDTIAYCLIPNHFHILIRVKDIDHRFIDQIRKEKTAASQKFLSDKVDLTNFMSTQFRRFFSSHSLYVNTKYNIRGSLFQNKVKRVLVKSETKFWKLVCYIHHNPIHHGLCKRYEEWRYSSYNNYFNNTTIINPQLIIDELGGGEIEKAKKEFFNLHQSYKENFVNS